MDDDEKRKEYEGIEMERDDQLILIEEEALTAKQQAHEHAHILMETQRKLLVIEGDFDKACQRCDAAIAKEQSYLELIEKNGEELRTLEDRDNQAAEREFEAEEKLRLVHWAVFRGCIYDSAYQTRFNVACNDFEVLKWENNMILAGL